MSTRPPVQPALSPLRPRDRKLLLSNPLPGAPAAEVPAEVQAQARPLPPVAAQAAAPVPQKVPLVDPTSPAAGKSALQHTVARFDPAKEPALEHAVVRPGSSKEHAVQHLVAETSPGLYEQLEEYRTLQERQNTTTPELETRTLDEMTADRPKVDPKANIAQQPPTHEESRPATLEELSTGGPKAELKTDTVRHPSTPEEPRTPTLREQHAQILKAEDDQTLQDIQQDPTRRALSPVERDHMKQTQQSLKDDIRKRLISELKIRAEEKESVLGSAVSTKAALEAQRRLNQLHKNPDERLVHTDHDLLKRTRGGESLLKEYETYRDVLGEDERLAEANEKTLSEIQNDRVRRDSPDTWQQQNRQRLDAMKPAELEQEMRRRRGDMGHRQSKFTEKLQDIQQQQQALHHKYEEIEKLNDEEVRSGTHAGDTVLDEQGRTWTRARFQEAQQWGQHMQAQEQELLKERARLSDASHAMRQEQEVLSHGQSRQQHHAEQELRKKPGMAPLVDALNAAKAEAARMRTEFDQQHPPGSPDREAAEAELVQRQRDLTSPAQQRIRDQERNLQTAAQDLYRIDQEREQGYTDSAVKSALWGERAYAEDAEAAEDMHQMEWQAQLQRNGLSEHDASRMLEDTRKMDFEKHGRDAVVLSDGRIEVNPKHLFDYKKYADAVRNAPGKEQAKQAALSPESQEALQNQFIQQHLTTIGSSSNFQSWQNKQGRTNRTPEQTHEDIREYMHQLDNWQKLGIQLESAQTQFGLGVNKTIAAIGSTMGSDGLRQWGRDLDETSQYIAAADAATGAADVAYGVPGMAYSTALSLLPAVAGGGAASMASTRLATLAKSSRGILKAGEKLPDLGLVGSAAVSGAQSYGSVYWDARRNFMNQGLSEEEAEQRAQLPAALSGLATALVTAGFGRKGTESFLNPSGVDDATRKSLGSFMKLFVKEGASEGVEEATNSMLQSIIDIHTHNPELSIDEVLTETLISGGMGFLFGGVAGMSSPRGPIAANPTTNPTAAERNAPTAETSAIASGRPLTQTEREDILREFPHANITPPEDR